MALSPKDHPELYDVLIMAGDRVSPGRVRLNGHDRNKNWDIKAAKGQTGASSTLNGDPLGEFEATFELVEDPYDGVDDFADWENFSRWLHSLVNGPSPIAVPSQVRRTQAAEAEACQKDVQPSHRAGHGQAGEARS
jgi:hypothetical protein